MLAQSNVVHTRKNDRGAEEPAAPGIPALRAARDRLTAAVNAGDEYLLALRDELEDELIAALARARREREEAKR
jgi:hypothetical protein